MTTKWISCAAAVAVATSLMTSAARANIFFSASPSGTGDNVVFNEQPPNQTGNPIFGNVSNPQDSLVRFASSETLTTPSGGQTRIEAVDQSLNFLDTRLAQGGGFHEAVFTLNTIPGGTGMATITATNQFGLQSAFTLVLGNGQNFFTLTTDALQFITDVMISTTVGLADVRQIRLGDVVAVPGPVVGGGLPALLAALGALLVLGRRRHKQSI